MRFWIYLLIGALVEQGGSSPKPPEGWKIRLDRPGSFSSEPYFVSVPPGWQITTGPFAIAYDPAATARGKYRLESEIALLPGGQNDSYGVFVGGTSLDSNDLAYMAFQLRRDGKFSIWSRKGPATRDIVPWTSHPAIRASAAGAEPPKNLLAIEVRPTEVAFLANGRTVYLSGRTALMTDGNFGFRVDENVSIRATTLSVQNLP